MACITAIARAMKAAGQAGGLDLRGHLAQLLLGPGGQDDVGARFGQGDGGGGADTAAAPCDDGYLVGHAESVEDHGPGL